MERKKPFRQPEKPQEAGIPAFSGRAAREGRKPASRQTNEHTDTDESARDGGKIYMGRRFICIGSK